MNTYLVTGGTGLLGSHLIKKVLAEGGKVRCLRRSNSDLSMLAEVANQIEWADADILDITALGEAMQGVDYVIHAAAMVHFGHGPKRTLMGKVNIQGTQQVVNAALDAGVKKICYISSVAAVGRQDDKEYVDETGKWEDAAHPSFYGFTKYHGELEVWRGMAEGLDAVAVNPSIVMGTGDWGHSSLKILQYIWKGKRFVPVGNINCVDARDVADAVWMLLHSPISGERFILNGFSMSYKDFFEEVSGRFGKNTKYILFKPWMGAIAWRLAWAASLLLGKAPIINKETIESSAMTTKFDGSKIARMLGFRYRSKDDTLSWTCQQVKQ